MKSNVIKNLNKRVICSIADIFVIVFLVESYNYSTEYSGQNANCMIRTRLYSQNKCNKNTDNANLLILCNF